MSKRVYGIDLGTTYSCISYVDSSGRPTVVANSEGDQTTPSVVYFETPQNIVVGKSAKDVASLFPDQVVSMVKRCMGQAGWKKEVGSEIYTPQRISSQVLRKIVKDAAEVVGEPIEEVVITCPAYFGINEREATREAGILAGLNVRAIINEPTAAAIAYGMQQAGDQTVMVYDLGGGTFDVTIITLKEGNITVIATDGNHQLGGGDWDECIVRHFASCFEQQTGTSMDDLLRDKETYNTLLLNAEKCKVLLTSRESVKEVVRHETSRADVVLERAKFNELTQALLEQTIALTNQSLEKAAEKGVRKSDIGRVLLVGGSTYMPQVEARVKQEFSCPVERKDPNLIVAKGAALYGLREQLADELAPVTGAGGAVTPRNEQAVQAKLRQLASETGISESELSRLSRVKVTNVASKSFGLVARSDNGDMKIFNLIRSGEELPRSTTSTDFCTEKDKQTGVRGQVSENTSSAEEVPVEDGRVIGELGVTFGSPLPKGTPIHVTFTLNAEGRLLAQAREPQSGRAAQVEIQTESKTAPEELARQRRLDDKKTVS